MGGGTETVSAVLVFLGAAFVGSLNAVVSRTREHDVGGCHRLGGAAPSPQLPTNLGTEPQEDVQPISLL
jgi:hypothetical protein